MRETPSIDKLGVNCRAPCSAEGEGESYSRGRKEVAALTGFEGDSGGFSLSQNVPFSVICQ